MKSRKAKWFIERYKVILEKDLTVIGIESAIKSVELAEAEMREQAIGAHRNRCQTCAVSTHERICGDRNRVKSVADFGITCDDDCNYMRYFIAAIDNDKTI